MIRSVLGLLLCLGAWQWVLRRGAGARSLLAAPVAATALDVAPILVGFAAALAATARPVLSGLAVAALATGLSIVDRVKRVVLREPVVFADRAELLEIVRHPGLYLPFAGSNLVIGAVAVALVALVAGLAWLEPPLWHRSLGEAGSEGVAAGLAAYGCLHVTSAWPGSVHRLAAFYGRRLAPSRDPARDAASLGPLAALAVHATTAAAERPGRRAVAAARPALPFPAGAGPVVLVQAESFMDPGALHSALAGLLPHLRSAATQRGRLAVPAWGANTVRTEFAVLAGLPQEMLGLDEANAYESFVAATPVLATLPQLARTAGYRTVFVHPFALHFYGRDRVMPRLGFDELIGPAAFADAPRRGKYVADAALGSVVAGVLRRHGPRVFVFVATMEAHGPWPGTARAGEAVALPAGLPASAESGQLARWLWHLQGTDRLIGGLQDLVVRDGSGWLAVYGDHQPSLPAAFAALGVADSRTDYAIWGGPPGMERERDLPACDLGHTLLEAMRTGAQKAA